MKEIANLEQIKKALTVEIKYKYVNLIGNKQTFAQFMKSQIRLIMKQSAIPERWKIILDCFELYSTGALPDRKKYIELFVKVMKLELSQKIDKSDDETPNLDLSVTYIKGVGPKVGIMLNKLGIFTAKDLLFYFPRKHIDYSQRTLIKNLQIGQTTTVFGYIRNVECFVTPKGLGVLKVKIGDETGTIDINFFYAKSSKFILERTKRQFPKGAGIVISGTVKLNSYDGKYTLENTTYSIMSEDFLTKDNLNLARIVPIYSLSENLNIKTLRKAIYNAIQIYKNTIVNIVPDYIREKYHLLDKKLAVEQIHFPDSMELLEQARFSLIFEELFLVQLKLARTREQNRKENKSIPLHINLKKGLVMDFIKSLPFELTGAQKRAVNEILNDMNSTEPMQRLLQGDVGSGKTVVACIMLLAAVENGYQAAIMAPTEILAQQHYNNLVKWLSPLGLRVGLFLGSLKKKQRDIFGTDLRNGQIDIAVGTHALIQESVEFRKLGAVVIDEQHRFGVNQRLMLRKKAENPQILTMTATPIPRTLAITMNGDLDLTIIDELPKGRKPVLTSLNMPRKEIYSLIRKEIESGHQAYIVYPLIEESETLSAKAATKEAERLQQTIFKDLRIGLLHGKLKNNEKDEVMEKFKNNEYDILVATTVVEVGVDVPNATVIVIENAERFGLSQLHQLRGRVGRCNLQSYCILSTGNASQEVKNRLSVMTETNDGFVIAEKDLEIRGPGEFLGVRQSGLPDLMISDIVRDAKILEMARASAIDFVHNHNIKDFPYLEENTNLTLDGTLLLGT